MRHETTRLPESEKVFRHAVKFFSSFKTNKKTGCLEWTRACSSDGYGCFQSLPLLGEKRVIGTHRAMWIIVKGAIPEGLCVLHKCDNPKCGNPSHLFLGTLKDNSQDMLRKGRRGTRDLPSGEDHHYYEVGRKITRKDAIKIRRMKGTTREIGALFGIGGATVSKIKTGKLWKDPH